MKETKFKILMHCGMYVDANMLETGIYSCSKPYLYNNDETIDKMIEKAQKVKEMTATNFISNAYFENLKQCVLVDVELNFL